MTGRRGDVDELLIARYLAGECDEEERCAVDKASDASPRVRECLELAREALLNVDSDENDDEGVRADLHYLAEALSNADSDETLDKASAARPVDSLTAVAGDTTVTISRPLADWFRWRSSRIALLPLVF